MSFLWLLILSVGLLWLACNALWLLGAYAINFFNERSQKTKLLRQKVGAFFVSHGDVFVTSIYARGPKSDQVREQVKGDVVVVIDHSSSMQGAALENARYGAKIFSQNSMIGSDNVNIGVAGFNHTATIFHELSADREAVESAIDRVPEAGGGTDILEGLQVGYALLEKSKRKGDDSVHRVLILISDGDGYNADTIDYAESIKDKGIRIFCIGVGIIHEEFLKNIAGEKGLNEYESSFFTIDSEDLVRMFERIRELIVGPTGKNAKIEHQLNEDYLVYLGTPTGQSLTRLKPLTWHVPWLKEEWEEIRYRIKPTKCAYGYIKVNRFQVVEGKRHSVAMRFNQVAGVTKGENEYLDSRRYIFVSPFPPGFLWGLLIFPPLWHFVRWWCGRKDQPSFRAPADPILPSFQMGALPQDPAKSVQEWNPVICLALGGGGIAAALRFKAFISDASGGIFPEDRFRFIFIDTHDHSEILPQFGAETLDKKSFVCIGSDLWPDHVQLMKGENDVGGEWYPYRSNEDLDREMFITTSGTRRNRLLGRLALHRYLADHVVEAETPESSTGYTVINKGLVGKIDEAVEWLGQAAKKGNPQTIVMCTPSGGTGSAIFQDIVHILLTALDGSKKTEGSPVKVILPETEAPQDPADPRLLEIYLSNKTAFLLELERIKTAVSHPLSIPEYPGDPGLEHIRFTSSEYFVYGMDESSESALVSAGALALGFAGNQSDFNADLKLHVETVQPKGNHHIVSPISARMDSRHHPIKLINQYAEAKLVLYLLDKKLGILLYHDRFDVTKEFEFDIHPLLDLVFFGDEDNPNISHDVPILFQFIPELIRRDGHDGVLDLLIAALADFPEDVPPDTVYMNHSGKAITRLVEWSFYILNQFQGSGLAATLMALEAFDEQVCQALHIITLQDITERSPEDLLLFSTDRMDLLHKLLTNYRRIVKDLIHHLNSWAFALAEGYPLNWTLGPNVKAQTNYVGLARRFARRLTLIRERLNDYAKFFGPKVNLVDVAEDVFKESITRENKTLDTIMGRIGWGLNEAELVVKIRVDIEKALVPNPYRLKFSTRNDKQIQIEKPGLNIKELEEGFFSLTSLFPTWSNKATIKSLNLKNIHPIYPEEHNRFEATIGLDETESKSYDAFVNGSSNIRLSICFNEEFRASALYNSLKSTEQLRAGMRRHVHRSDIFSAAFQRIVFQAGFMAETPPMHPLVVHLMNDLHRLQYFLCLLLANDIKTTTYPGTFQDALAVNIPLKQGEAEQLLYITGPQSKPDLLSGAVRFILQGTCIKSGVKIPVPGEWRPSVEDIERITQATDKKNSHLYPDITEFKLVVQAMAQAGGYIHPIGCLDNLPNYRVSDYK